VRVTVGLNWFWLGIAATAPLAAALILSLPFWRRQSDSLLGSVIGSGVVFAAAVFFISREYLELDSLRASCAAAEVPCFFKPTDFNRYAIYGTIAFAEVMTVFTVGLSMEERARRRTRAPEWR
jgi:hypothetical protein